MKKRQNINSSGFTLIELMIVLVSIGILIAIVAYTYNGIQARSINTKKEAAIRSLQVSLEKFYSTNMYYPSLTNINNSSWRVANMANAAAKMIQDPTWNAKNTACTVDGEAILLRTPQNGCFGYSPTNNGVSCQAAQKTCNQYSLSATLEQNSNPYTLHQLD